MRASSVRVRLVVALVLIGSLVLAACGTRLDRATIASALGGGQSGAASERGPGDGAASGDLPGAGGSDADGTESGPQGSMGKPRAAVSDQGGAADATGDRESRSAGSPGADSGAGKAKGGPIVIGTVGPFSGPGGVVYGAAARGVQAWASSINARGGISGRKVEVVVYDDGGNAAKSKSQVRDLVERRGGVAVVGGFGQHVTAWAKYVTEKKVPVIGGGCSVPEWNETPMLFPQCASADTFHYSTVAVAGKMGKSNKWGALICRESSGCTEAEDLWFNKGYAKRAGLNPLYRAKISLAQADFTSECISARNAGVEVLTVGGDPNTLARVGASCRRQGYNPQYAQPGVSVAANSPEQPGLSDILVSSPGFPFAGLKTPAAREFATAWQRYSGGTALSGAASLGWTSGKLFEVVAKKAGSGISHAGLVKAFNSIRDERLGGLTPPLTFPAGKPAPDFRCWFVMRTSNGKWTAPQGDKLACR